MCRWFWLLAIVAAGPACTNLRLAFTYQDSHSHGGCRMVRSPRAPQVHRDIPQFPRGVAGSPHAEWSQLRPFRGYFRVSEVTPFRHRLVARFRCPYERTVRFQVESTPGEPVIQLDTSSVPLAIEPMPPELAAVARAVRKKVAESFEGESDIRIEYAGGSRHLHIEEVVSNEPAGDPLARSAWMAGVIVAVNRNLTAARGNPVRQWSHFTRMCSGVRCSEPPRWIPMPDQQLATRPRLSSLTYSSSQVPASVRADFIARALKVARQIEANEPRVALADLPVQKAAALLPADLRQNLELGFRITAQPRQGTAGRHTLEVAIPLADVVYKGGSGSASTTIEGVKLETEIRITSPTPPAPATRGRIKIELFVEATLRDNRGNHEKLDGVIEGTFVVDGRNAAAVDLQVPAQQRHRLTSRVIRLPGEGRFGGFVVVFQLGKLREWQWGSDPKPALAR